jgi:DNA-directed RNA polymerase specialized sigma24 family protein
LSKGDDLFHAYLRANAEDSEQALAQLCTEVLFPECRIVVRARLWRHREDVEDVTQDVVLRLVRRLRQIRVDADHSPIRDVAEWAMGAASKACSDFLRKEHPLRTHLANALRYRFSKSTAFRLWKGPNGRTVCGWHRCRGAPPLTEPAFQQLLALPRVAVRLAAVEPEYSVRLWRALASVFACADGPIYFQSLVSELISRSVIGDGRTSRMEDIPEPASHAHADDIAARKELLGALWQAVMTLPRDERLSLLLNLRGTEGLAAWWQHDVMPLSTVADAVELSPEKLPRLPLGDLEIADVLGLDEANEVKRRQRVINLRRSAKRRLANYFDFRQSSVRES